MNQIIGVDSSVSSIPSSTFTVDNLTANPVASPKETERLIKVERLEDGSFRDTYARNDPDGPVKFVPSVDYAVNQIVIPALSKLLAKVLAITDASVPNKDQNRGVKKIIREAFDEAYFQVLRGAFPDVQFGQMTSFYSLEPEPDKKTNGIL